MLDQIEDYYSSTKETSKRFKYYFKLKRKFLRQQYYTNAQNDINVVRTHGIFHSLNKPTDETLKKNNTCNAFKFARFFLDEVGFSILETPIKIPGLIMNTVATLDNIDEKIKHNQGHRVAVANR